jgi:mono/diheme cytochrome c family protein
MKLRLVGAATVCLVLAIASAAVTKAENDPAESGKRIYERANCVGCHKWSGVGGGGYGGAALSLRKTELAHADIVEIVTCGRPGTGMPHFTADPYKDGACYGLKAADVKDMMPPTANVVLRPQEIDAVASYVEAHIKGKGDPTLADCTDFFGDASRVCDIYRPKPEAGAARHPLPMPATMTR